MNWMKEGDRNTKFFHRVASGRKIRNHVDEFGVVHTNEKDIYKGLM